MKLDPLLRNIIPLTALTIMACGESTTEPRSLKSSPALERLSPSPAASTSLTFRQVSAGGSHGCGVTIEGQVYCWGYNTGHPINYPVPVATTVRFRSVSAGGGFTCGVAVSSALYCWGDNRDGQLGNGTTTASPKPVRVQTSIRMREVSAGTHHACSVSEGDIVYCWGRNDHGQVGDGTTAARRVPIRPVGWAHFSTVSAGDEFTCGVTTTNAVTPPDRAYCWGAVSTGHYGDQTTLAKTLRPTAVPGRIDFDSVQSGLTHVCGITPEHQAYCWGANNWMLGSPSSGSGFQVTPRLVAGGHAFRSVDTGTYWSCGVTVRDVAFCWGVRSIGVGDGTPGGSPTPVEVGGQLHFRAVSTGGQFSCGLAIGGDVYCWGDTGFGPTPLLISTGS